MSKPEIDALRQAREALHGLVELASRPGENANETFERVGDLFYLDTGMLRPGKSEPAELETEKRNERRREAWIAWVARRWDAARTALAAIDAVLEKQG